MASSSSSTHGKPSRFPSFKVFKLTSSKKNKDGPPPPPPPKDSYYLHNRSLASLLPDSLSLPATPLTGPFHYQFPRKPNAQSLHPNSSTMSLASSTASAASFSPEMASNLSHKKSGFFKFGRRSPRSPSVRSGTDDTSHSTQPPDDDGISLPWNFQHNVHVDDGLAGLPPSWMSQLADAGLDEDEIEAITQARRNGARSPASQYLFDRPHSPAMSTRTNATNASSVLSRPGPRSTSLPRQYSDHSHSTHPIPPMPAIRPSASKTSISSSSNHTTISRPRMRNNSGNSLSISVISDHHPTTATMDQAASPAGADGGRPTTPPARRFHVANASPGLGSPPPSYASSVHGVGAGYPADTKERPPFNGAPLNASPEPSPPRRTDSNASSATRRSKRFTILPPRLSLHDHDISDLSLWSEALISAIPNELSSNPSSPSGSGGGFSTLATAGTIVSPSQSFLSSSSASPSGTATSPLQSSMPPVVANGHDDANSSPPNTSQLVGPSWAWDRQPSPNVAKFTAPALSETASPTLPLAFPDGKPEANGKRLSGRRLDDDDGDTDRHSYLSAGSSDSRRDSSMSSTSTMSNITVTAATAIVRNVSVARRATANMVDRRKPMPLPGMGEEEGLLPSPTVEQTSRPDSLRHPNSPLSSHFGSEEGSGSTSSSVSQETPTDQDRESASLMYYTDELSPDPHQTDFGPDTRQLPSRKEAVDLEEDLEEEDESDEDLDVEEAAVSHLTSGSRTSMALSRPTIVISSVRTPSPGPLTALTGSATPATPAPRYRGWLSEVIKPLEDFIDESIDPREYYSSLLEIAEGESGSVFAATLGRENLDKLRLPEEVKNADITGETSLVAIKCVAILPSGSDKLLDLEKELKLLRGMRHPHLLGMDALYVDLQEDSLWIRMELMERSLADVIGLAGEGLMLQERMIARFAGDTLDALQYLQMHHIAHRDVRSDNLLLNSQGVVKLTDFSNAVRVSPQSSTCSDQVGVLYWQAPEIRAGPYDAMKIDVWSLGATVWEMAESEPPFADAASVDDRWPPLSQPKLYSPAFRDFLRACSEPAGKRPTPVDLSKNTFISNACGRAVIVQVLAQCTAIEETLQERGEDYPS